MHLAFLVEDRIGYSPSGIQSATGFLLYCQIASRTSIFPIMETCYKAFRRDVIQSIPIEEDRFGFEPEITAKVARAGARVYEVPISYHGRTYEEGKKIGWKDGVRAMYCIVKYGVRRRSS